MSDRSFVYVDGESHFLRSEAAWKDIHGEDATLDRMRFVDDPDDALFLVIPEAKIFWSRRMNPGVARAYYFTAAVGGDDRLHTLKVALRDFELHPQVFKEAKQLASQRKNRLMQQGLIEKAKQVDIALTVKMIEDARRAMAYDVCHLYTSDIDFLPAIEVLMSNGNRVHVHGFKNGLSERSPLFHVPDQFIDLEEMFRAECMLLPLTDTTNPGAEQ